MRRHETPNQEYQKPSYFTKEAERLAKEAKLFGKKLEATVYGKQDGHTKDGSRLFCDGKQMYEGGLNFYGASDAERLLTALVETNTDPSGMSKEELEIFTLNFEKKRK